MANYTTCRTCGAPLHGDDIAIYRKLVYRGAEDFLCISCLADYFKCPKEEIEKRIHHNRRLAVHNLAAVFSSDPRKNRYDRQTGRKPGDTCRTAHRYLSVSAF